MKLSEIGGEISVGNENVNIPLPQPEPDEGFAEGLLGEGFLGELPQMIGSFASLPLKTTPAGMAVSGIGGAGGEAFKQLGQHFTGSELAPQTSGEAAGRIGRAFLEEVAFEGVGRGVSSLAKGIGSKIKPEVKEGFEALEENFAKFGGKLSATQKIEHKNLASWSLLTLDGLSRGSITAKGIFKNFDQMNEQALKRMSDNLIEEISETATRNLSDHQIGRIFVESIDTGRAAHSMASGVNYSAVDNLSKQFGVTVDTGRFKSVAANWKTKFSKIANIGSSEIADAELDKALRIGKEIGFEDAHFMRSALLSKQRQLELAGETGVSKKVIGDLIDVTNKMMDEAGTNTGIQEAYKKASKFHKFGASSFNDRFLVKLLQKSPERIGETIFKSGNVDQIIKARQSLMKASLVSKDVNFNKTWTEIQEGYMSGLLSGPLVDDAGTPVGSRILKMFEDKKKLRTMKQALSQGQLKSLNDFAKTAKAVQDRPEAGLGMVMQLTQGGAIVGVASGIAPGASAIPVFIGPPVVAKLLTNPDKASALIKAISTPVTSSESTTIISKLIGALSSAEQQQIEKDSQIMSTVGEIDVRP